MSTIRRKNGKLAVILAAALMVALLVGVINTQAAERRSMCVLMATIQIAMALWTLPILAAVQDRLAPSKRFRKALTWWIRVGRLTFKAGTYVLSTAVIVNKTGITLDGDGAGATIVQVSGPDDRFTISGCWRHFARL